MILPFEDGAAPAVADDPMNALVSLQENADAGKRRKAYVSKRRKDHGIAHRRVRRGLRDHPARTRSCG